MVTSAGASIITRAIAQVSNIMADSWEDDDADVTLPGAAAPPAAWDDEEEEEDLANNDPPPKPPPAPSTEKKVVAEKDPDAVVIKLDNMNDHLKLVPLLLERFDAKKSKDSHVFMFVKELLKKTESRFSAAECGDLAIMAGNYQKTKQQAIDKPTESNAKKKSKKKSKKEKLEQKKKVDDLFGVAEAGEYDHYEDQYDDFF